MTQRGNPRSPEWLRTVRGRLGPLRLLLAHLYLLQKNAWYLGVNKYEDIRNVPVGIRHSQGERSLMYTDITKRTCIGNRRLWNTLYILERPQIQEYRSCQYKHQTRFRENFTMYLTVLFLLRRNLKFTKALVHFRFVWLSRNKTNKMQPCNRIYYSTVHWVPTQTWLRPVTTWVCKPEAANTARAPDDERYAARNMLSLQWTVE